ncbi:MAG: hypothetical protein ACI8XO_003274 [Verrucomicrobiales bacterium]|jgi:hypothetical protein
MLITAAAASISVLHEPMLFAFQTATRAPRICFGLRERITTLYPYGSNHVTKGLSVNNSYNLLVILAITRVSFQLK